MLILAIAQSFASRNRDEKAARKLWDFFTVIKVNPRETSQDCGDCLNLLPKGLSERWNCCYHCGLTLDKDVNSAILSKKVGIAIASLTKAQLVTTGKVSPRPVA